MQLIRGIVMFIYCRSLNSFTKLHSTSLYLNPVNKTSMVYHTQVLPWSSSHERYCTNTLLQYYVIVCPFVVALIGNVLVPKSIINDIISIFKKHRFFDELHVQSTWLFICGTFIQMLMFKKNLQQSKNKKRTARIPNISNCAIWFFSYLFSMCTQ